MLFPHLQSKNNQYFKVVPMRFFFFFDKKEIHKNVFGCHTIGNKRIVGGYNIHFTLPVEKWLGVTVYGVRIK